MLPEKAEKKGLSVQWTTPVITKQQQWIYKGSLRISKGEYYKEWLCRSTANTNATALPHLQPTDNMMKAAIRKHPSYFNHCHSCRDESVEMMEIKLQIGTG